tara:strand:- start:6350 stop:7318 length:969 start_codon:yes stop_codon:yes gene_type:complete
MKINNKLGLGGATFGGSKNNNKVISSKIFGNVSIEKSIELIEYAYNKGIKTFDTSPLYGSGKSEISYGKAIKNFKRDDFFISSKCGRIIKDKYSKNLASENSIINNNVEIVFDYSEKGIISSVEESLKRLNLNYLDSLLLHDPDQADMEKEAVETAFPSMIRLKEEGIVKNIGCGINQWEMPMRFYDHYDLDYVLLAGRYTLLENKDSKLFMEKSKKLNTKITIGGPFNSGILARNLNSPVSYNYELAPEKLINKAKKIEIITNKYGISLKSAALNFLLKDEMVTSIVPGMSSINEIDENIKISKDKIPEKLWNELKNNNYI